MFCNRKTIRGTTTVEFAIVGALLFTVLLGVLEFGRLLFVWNTVTEATRRGARVAVICPVNDPAIQRIAVFNDPGSGGPSSILPNLSPADVTLEYLDEDGGVIAAPAGNFGVIRYVRVRIPNYQHQLLIPGFGNLLDVPQFETTLPRESLGVPRVGVVTPC